MGSELFKGSIEDHALMAKIGERVKKLRERAGISQQKLAQELGCTSQWIVQLEKGRTNAALTRISAIAQLFGLQLSELLKDL